MKTKLAQGTCRFCGQMVQVEVPEQATQDYIDDAVIDVCNCKEAKKESEKRQRLQNVKGYIRNLFDTDPEKQALFNEAIERVYDKTVRKVKLQDWEWNYEIKVDSDDYIYIGRMKQVKEETTF